MGVEYAFKTSDDNKDGDGFTMTGDLFAGDLGLDDINDGGVRERTEIAKLVTFARDDFTHDTTHDLQKS